VMSFVAKLILETAAAIVLVGLLLAAWALGRADVELGKPRPLGIVMVFSHGAASGDTAVLVRRGEADAAARQTASPASPPPPPPPPAHRSPG
jgi:hypothetical protein